GDVEHLVGSGHMLTAPVRSDQEVDPSFETRSAGSRRGTENPEDRERRIPPGGSRKPSHRLEPRYGVTHVVHFGGGGQGRQSSRPPQPSDTVPHRVPHVCGVHPQTCAVPPPPHVWGVEQVPQLTTLPQPLFIGSQFHPSDEHAVGAHPQTPPLQ